MTVVESIIKWFASFNINDIDTDALGGQSASYGIAKEPVQQVKTYLSGKKLYTDYYDFLVRLDSKTDTERSSNHDFMKKLTEWIEKQDREYKFPELPEHLKCRSIGISTPFHMQSAGEDTAIYLFTIKIKYEKEG